MKKKTKKKQTSSSSLSSPSFSSSTLAVVLAAIIVILILLVASGVLPRGVQKKNTRTTGSQTASITILNANSTQATQQDGGMKVTLEAGAIPAGDRVQYKIDHFKKLALQPLEFQVFDENHKALTPNDLQIVHDSKLHYFVVSANLKEFQHLNPVFEEGKWKVLANLPNPGTYYAYVDIVPVKGKPAVLRSDLIVQNPTNEIPKYPGLTPDLFAIVKNYKAQLVLTRPIIYQQTLLTFQLTDVNNVVVSNLKPYLGSLGHVTIFKQGDANGFLHTHPLSSSNASQGLVEFVSTFAQPGTYTAFAEFMLGSRVYTFPITFEISGS